MIWRALLMGCCLQLTCLAQEQLPPLPEPVATSVDVLHVSDAIQIAGTWLIDYQMALCGFRNQARTANGGWLANLNMLRFAEISVGDAAISRSAVIR